MRTTAAICELLLLVSAVHAFVELPVAKHHSVRVPRRRVKRQDSLSTNIFDAYTWSNGGAYYLNVTVGNPPQQQIVLLDTGSSDLYFDASSAPECQTTGARACKGGTFKPNASTSYEILRPAPAFNQSFADGSTALGPFGRDTLCLSDVCVDDVQFGLATKVDSTIGFAIGLMGVGYSLREAVASIKALYPNVPDILVEAGEINSRLYSLFLNSEAAVSGSILFGAVDTSKYTGDLQLVDILPDPIIKAILEFLTTITSVKATISGKSSTVFAGGSASSGLAAFNSTSSFPVIMDSGTAAFEVPPQVAKALAELYPYANKYGQIDCSHIHDDASLTITFADKIDIKVPISELITPVYNSTTQQPLPWHSSGQQCQLMIFPTTPSPQQPYWIVGDAVLRSMYVVYDLDNGQMGLAQANTKPGAPNIKVVQAGPDGIARAVSNVRSAPAVSSTPPVAFPINGTFVASKATSTIGTATGLGAVPASVRPATASSGHATSGSTSGAAVSSGAAAAVAMIPGAGSGLALWAQGAVVLLGMGLGALWVM